MQDYAEDRQDRYNEGERRDERAAAAPTNGDAAHAGEPQEARRSEDRERERSRSRERSPHHDRNRSRSPDPYSRPRYRDDRDQRDEPRRDERRYVC